MRFFLLATSAALLALPQVALAEPCVTSGDPKAGTISTTDPEVGAPLLVQLALWLGFLAERDLPGQLASAATTCERSGFRANRLDYTLRGENGDDAILRIATSQARGATTAYLTPVVDLMAVLQPGHAGPAPIRGYALVTTQKDEHTAWRIYDRIPADEVLAKAMGQTLAREIRPLIRIKGKTVSIIVPESGSGAAKGS